MTYHSVVVLMILLGLGPMTMQDSIGTEEAAAVKEVLVNAYVRGVFIERDEKLVKDGFHPEFTMQVLNDEEIITASLDMWLDRLSLNSQKNPNKIEHEFKFIDIVDRAAISKMEIFKNSRHLYTDYFSLYKFKNGWKIVSKIFAKHD